MDSGGSDRNSRYRSLTLSNPSSAFPSTGHYSLLWDEISQSPPHPKAHRLPVEIFSEIFQYSVRNDPHSQTKLMLVCRHWHDMMLSTPGFHSQLRIGRWTRKKDVERYGRRWLLSVTVDIPDDPRWRSPEFNPAEYYACFMAAAESAPRWRSLALLSLAPFGDNKDLEIMHPLQHLESFKMVASCKFGNFLKPLLTAIITTVTPDFTVMEVFHPDAALYIVQLAHFQAFASLTTLRLTCRRMHNPVDILPSLHKLEVFEAHHLSLTIHAASVDLPLTQTLRDLCLKSVSIQWMAGQTFPALKECSIIFPQHADIFQSVYMPSCLVLKYDSNNLRTLEYFHHHPLARLEVKCGQWRTGRGNLQLAALHPIFAAQSLTCLHLEIKCSERLLAYMLGLASALEELEMGLSSPRALSNAFFLAFAAGGRNASAGLSGQTIAPLCRQLKKLHLHYKRWSRGAERYLLIPAFGAIVVSHQTEEQNFSFRLSLGEGPESQEWIIHNPVKRFDVELDRQRAFIGVSSSYGIVTLSRALVVGRYGPLTILQYPPLPRESEYITTREWSDLPIDYFFSFHSLKELRMNKLSLEIEPNTQFSPNALLFHTLKVLAVHRATPSFFAGQTFHKLERYQAKYDSHLGNPGQGTLTEMPLCTRLATSLSRLATLKLPQIRELVAYLDHKEPDSLWETHVTVNVNLSGLKLLSLSCGDYGNVSRFIDITKILGLLPSLETLVLESDCLVVPYVAFFEALIPMNAQGTSVLNRPSWRDQPSGVLCPRMESLQIEGIRLADQPRLIPVLKDIVTLRAVIGAPLKSFTFYCWDPKKWELIGKDGSFIMEEVVPALKFLLDI
jgi:hypothetical protein